MEKVAIKRAPSLFGQERNSGLVVGRALFQRPFWLLSV
jgi:hypothetical protein